MKALVPAIACSQADSISDTCEGNDARSARTRDPHKLAAFRQPLVKASEEQIAQSLEGNWQPDLLFVLKQKQDGYEFCQQRKWPSAIGSSTTISSSGRIAAKQLLCR